MQPIAAAILRRHIFCDVFYVIQFLWYHRSFNLFTLGSDHKVRKYKEYHSTVYVPSSELDSPNHSLASEWAPPPSNGGGGTLAGGVRGWGSTNADDWRKSLALCLLCGSDDEVQFTEILFSFPVGKYSM